MRGGVQRGKEAAQADVHRAQVGNFVYFYLGVQLAVRAQNLLHLVGGHGVQPAAKAHQLHQVHVRLAGHILRRRIQPGVVGPLVQHAGRGLFPQMADRVLAHHGGALGGNQLFYAVVDFIVQMVGPPGQHQDGPSLGAGLGQHRLATLAHPCQVGVILGVGPGNGGPGLGGGDVRPVFLQNFGELFAKIRRAVDADIVVNKALSSQLGAACRNHLGVIGHHRAVVAVVALALVDIIAHAGVENGVDIRLGGQGVDVPVHQLGGVAHRVAGNGALPGKVELAGAARAGHHLKAQGGEQAVPEGQGLEEIQAHGQAQLAARAGHRAVAVQQALLVLVQVQGVPGLAAGEGAVAAVAADELPPAVEEIDG